MANPKKIEVARALSQSIQTNPHLAVLQFEKTSHKSLETLRKSLKKLQTNIAVVKSSLLTKAIEQSETVAQSVKTALPLKNTSALLPLGAETWHDILRTVQDFMKKDPTVQFKFAFLNNTFYDTKDTVALSKLPGKTELYGKILGSIKSPVTKLTLVLQEYVKKGGATA